MPAPVVYITGITRGIGRATALALAQRGATVAGCYRERDDEAATLRDELRGVVPFLVQKADVRDGAAARQSLAAVEAEFGGLDVLINNAGVLRFGYLGFSRPADAADVLETNLGGTATFTAAVIPALLRRGGGTIINLLSAVATANPPGAPCALYSASKAAAGGLTADLARTLVGQNIRVYALAPGFIDTDMLAPVSPGIIDPIRRRIPLGRLGRPEEMAAILCFLALDAPTYMTGSLITADGGYSA